MHPHTVTKCSLALSSRETLTTIDLMNVITQKKYQMQSAIFRLFICFCFVFVTKQTCEIELRSMHPVALLQAYPIHWPIVFPRLELVISLMLAHCSCAVLTDSFCRSFYGHFSLNGMTFLFNEIQFTVRRFFLLVTKIRYTFNIYIFASIVEVSH